jgi:putative membrane protein
MSNLSKASWFFLVWSMIGGFVMAAGLDQADVGRFGLPDSIQSLARIILSASDALWIVMAAVFVFHHECRNCGPRRAIQVFLAIGIPSAAAEWIGATTGLLFGSYDYMDQFGWRLWGVLPFTIPLAWYIVVVGSCRLLEFLPAMPAIAKITAAGALATLTDVNLEPVAIHIRGYWLWTNGENGLPLCSPPISNYLTWFILSAALALAVPLSNRKPVRTAAPRNLCPAGILIVMNLLFLLAHLGRLLRNS